MIAYAQMFGNKEQQQFVALQERTDQVRTFIADSPSKTATSTDSASLIDSVGKYLKLAPELTINPPDLVDVVLREASDSFDEYAAIKANRDQLKARKIKVHPGQQEAYAARIAELEAKINGAWKVTEAIKRGYEPYTVPNTLYVGTMSRKEAIDDLNDECENRVISKIMSDDSNMIKFWLKYHHEDYKQAYIVAR